MNEDLQKAPLTMKKELVGVQGLVMEELPQKAQKANKAGQVIKERWHMKAARCLFNAVFPNAVLTMFFVLNTKCSMWDRLII